jgi:prefoldin subunit 5
MTSGEYERVKRAVAIIDERDDTQDQRIASLEASLSEAIQRISHLERRISDLEIQKPRGR